MPSGGGEALGARRWRMLVEYDGTDFAGFQTQAAGTRTVQETLQRAVERVTGAAVVIHGAGRTDAGVHAVGQVAHFDAATRLDAARLEQAMNAVLPRDVSVRSVTGADAAFHARFSAVRRTYVYLIVNRPARSALWTRYAVHEPRPLDVGAMRRAGGELVGAADFGAFANSGGQPGATLVRRLERLQARRGGKDGELIVVRATANAFLRSMVRNLVGLLIAAGRGGVEPGGARRVLASGRREENPYPTAPAHGLCLYRVDYEERRNQSGRGPATPADRATTHCDEEGQDD